MSITTNDKVLKLFTLYLEKRERLSGDERAEYVRYFQSLGRPTMTGHAVGPTLEYIGGGYFKPVADSKSGPQIATDELYGEGGANIDDAPDGEYSVLLETSPEEKRCRKIGDDWFMINRSSLPCIPIRVKRPYIKSAILKKKYDSFFDGPEDMYEKGRLDERREIINDLLTALQRSNSDVKSYDDSLMQAVILAAKRNEP